MLRDILVSLAFLRTSIAIPCEVKVPYGLAKSQSVSLKAPKKDSILSPAIPYHILKGPPSHFFPIQTNHVPLGHSLSLLPASSTYSYPTRSSYVLVAIPFLGRLFYYRISIKRRVLDKVFSIHKTCVSDLSKKY